MARVLARNPRCNARGPGMSGQHALPEMNGTVTCQLDFLATVQQEGFLRSAHAGRRII